MAEQDLDQVMGEQLRQSEQAVAEGLVQLQATVPSREPKPDVPGGVRSDAELAEMGLSYDQIGKPKKEKTVELPEVQAIRQQYKAHLDKIKTGEVVIEEIGKAGRKVAEAIAPGVEVAGRAIGLDEEGAAALSKGLVEFVAGLPGQDDSDLTSGIETALAALPMVGAVVKGGKTAGKALGPLVAKEFEKAVATLKSERGSVPVSGSGGGAGEPPTPPSVTGATAELPEGQGANIQQGFKRKRDPRIDQEFNKAQSEAEGFVKAVEAQRRGTLSDQSVLELSKKSDLTLESLLELPPGTSLPPEHFNKARSILKSSHKAMIRSAKEARLEDTAESYRQMFQDLGTTRNVLVKMLGLYAEPSRTTRIMHQALPKKGTEPSGDKGFTIADPWINHLYQFFAKTEEAAKATKSAEGAAGSAAQGQITGSVLKEINPQDMRDFAEAVSGLSSEEEMVGFMKAIEAPTGWDVWKENWYNGMLMSLAPIKNLVGTPAILTAEIAQRGVMAGLDAGGTGLIRLLTDKNFQRSVYFGEVGQMVNMAANKEAFAAGARLAWHAFKTGKPEFDVSVLEHTVPDISNTALWLYTTGPMGMATSWMSTAAKRWTVKGIDLGTTTGARLLLAGDTFNKFVAHQAELRAIALRTAYQTVEREGLTGVEAVQRTQQVKREVLLHPELYPEAHERAKGFAQYVALQEPLGTVAEQVSSLADRATIGPRGSMGGLGGFPVGRWLMPFTTIMANAGKMAGEYSGPLSILSPAVQAELKAGGTRALIAQSKIAFSSLMLDQFYDMAREGLITGNGPRDTKANRQWQEATKKIPNAWYDPVSKEYRSCAAFEPFCTVTSAVADLQDMMSATPPDQTEAIQQAFQALAIAVVGNAGVKSWTQGLVGAMNTAQSGDFETYQKWFDKAIVGTTVPYSGVLRQVTVGSDPYMRKATDLIEQYAKDVPGISTSLPYDRNGLGKPMYRKGGWWDAFYHGHESEDPDIWQALNEHNYVLGYPEHHIDGIALDGQHYDAYFVEVTDGLDESLRQYIESHDEVSDGEFAKSVNKIVADHRQAGKDRFLREYGEIAEKIRDYDEALRDGTMKKPSKFTPGRTLQTTP